MPNHTTDINPSSDIVKKPMFIRDYLEIIFRNFDFIARFTFIAIIIGIVVLLIYPKTYTTKSVLMPPEDQTKQNLVLQAIASASALQGLTGQNNASELLMEVLKSRTVSENLIESENLQSILLRSSELSLPELERTELAVKALEDATKFTSSKQGYITIEVKVSTPFFTFSQADEDSAKFRAVRIAKGYIYTLDKLNRKLSNAKFLYNASYLEEQRSQAKIELDTAYSLLERFQRSNKAISISEQMRAQMETMSGLKAQIIAQQINLDMLLRDRLPTDLQVAESRNYLNELKNKYNEFQKGKGSDKYILGFEEVPALTREYATFFREVKIKEEVYSLINQLYYREKIQGFRDTPTVVVLDEPRVPALRSSPKRFISLIAIIALSLFLAVLTVIFRQSYLRSKQDEKTSMLWLLFNQSIKSLFKSVTVKSK